MNQWAWWTKNRGKFITDFQQSIPAMLRRLAEYAEKSKTPKQYDARPNSPSEDVTILRIFVRRMYAVLEMFFDLKRTPVKVIVAFAHLKFPEHKHHVDSEKVQDWLRNG
ncbi:MAG: hypothetical protein FWC38_02370 [Proteobacteria bacterium]|nr:hypothetical protein [Pseudomonadota bacterium]